MLGLVLQTTVGFLKRAFYKVVQNVFVKRLIKFFCFVYVFIYWGVWHYIHKNVFEFFGFEFNQFDFYSMFGVLNFYVALLDFENLFLLAYIIFYEIGIFEFLEERFS